MVSKIENDSNKQEIIKKFKDTSNIEIEKYDNKQIQLLLKELNKELDKKIIEEQQRYLLLLKELEKEEMLLNNIIENN